MKPICVTRAAGRHGYLPAVSIAGRECATPRLIEARPAPWYVLASQSGRRLLTLHDYMTVLYRQDDGSWVAEVPAISGCYALMPSREEALAELAEVFSMIAAEYREKNLQLPADTTEIVHA